MQSGKSISRKIHDLFNNARQNFNKNIFSLSTPPPNQRTRSLTSSGLSIRVDFVERTLISFLFQKFGEKISGSG